MSLLQSLLFGSISSTIGATSVYPLDKIKTRVQSSQGRLGPVGALRQVIATEGIVRYLMIPTSSPNIEILTLLLDGLVSWFTSSSYRHHPRKDY